MALRFPSVFGLTAALALSSACAGEIEPEVVEDDDAVEDGERDKRDAGRDGGRDAGGKRDSGARDSGRGEDSDKGDDDDDSPPAARTDDKLDAQVAARDASRGNTVAQVADAAVAEGSPQMSCSGNEPPLAAGLKVREVSLYQTVKLPLFKGGTWTAATAQSAPIVAGKKGLVRVFVDTLSGYQKRPVRARLSLGTASLVDERTIGAASTDADDGSTFSFQVEGAQITPDTQISVTLEDPSCGATPGMPSDARVPETGSQPLGAKAVGPLKVVILPISISGRLPQTSQAEVAKISSALLAFYPVPKVEVTVRATPLVGPATLAGTDNRGWTNLLNAVMRERSTDRAPSDVYYFGLVQPAASMPAYCGRGCILGIAPQTTRVSPSAQAGLGASFADAQTYETIIHEIGHAHGRGHAPCVKGGSIQGVDTRYPDQMGGSITEWGWDSRVSKLVPPTHKDVMGYCSPNWISPYTYSALAARSADVNKLALVRGALTTQTWHNVLLYGDGGARWGGTTEAELPGGEVEPATVLDAAGATIAQIEVVRLGLSDSTDQIVYLPKPAAGWATVVMSDRKLQLSSVEAAD